jgi:hypothetical protein
MNTMEKFHIYKEAINDNQLNYKHVVTPNKILETRIKSESLSTQV